MSNLLSNSQLKRLAHRAWRNLSIAEAMAKCFPEELGTPVAEDVVESGMESASEALAQLARIKIQLRLRRQIDARKAGAS